MATRRILIVEDNPSIARFIIATLKARQFDVSLANNDKDALAKVETEVLDLVILDIGIPERDGQKVCLRLIERSNVPIIMFSTKQDKQVRIGFSEIARDDYLTRLFALSECINRIRKALQHYSTLPSRMPKLVSTDYGIEINLARRTVSVSGSNVRLTDTEYLLLQELWINKDKVLRHEMLLKRVWGESHRLEHEYLRVFIGRLRQKLESDPRNPRYIITVHGVGYYLSVPHTQLS